METLYKKNICSHIEIMRMEELNHSYEVKERERQININHKEVEKYRQTMQPERERDEDDLPTKRRLTCWGNMY
jgi:hypothetical protein